MDEQIQQLIDELHRYPNTCLERQKALNRLLVIAQKLPGIYKSSHQDYSEALSLTWEWFCRKINDFCPRKDSIQDSLVIWINGYLKWRLKDLYTHSSNYTLSLDSPITNSEGEQTTLGERLVASEYKNTNLDLLDITIAKIQENQTECIARHIKQYIEQDREGKLTGAFPRKNPECNCHLLTKQLLLDKPPHKIADIAREFSVSNQTLYSHWKKICLPLLREIAINFGYEP